MTNYRTFSPPYAHRIAAWRLRIRRSGGQHLVVRALLLGMLAAVAWGCKPASEPRRLPTPADLTADASTSALGGAQPDVWLAAQISAASASERSVGPDSHSGGSAGTDRGDPTDPRHAIAMLTARAREAFARKDYGTLFALGASKPSDRSSEMLALIVRAHSLGGAPSRALTALKALHNRPDAARWLTLLRLHADTRPLRAKSRFRSLTRLVPIELSPTKRRQSSQLTQLVTSLRAAGLPVKVGKRWRGKVQDATIYYTRELPDAELVAKELHAALALPPQLLASRYLTKKRPIVLVLPPEAIAQLNPQGERARVSDFLGRWLVVAQDGRTHRFILKETGFFSWLTTHADGLVIERTGRYHLYATKIALSYRRIEHRGDVDNPLRQEQGRRSTHRFRLAADGFRLDGLQFRSDL